MAWKLLPTDYTDAVWSGLKRYTQVDNSDGTVSFNDVTTYTNKEKSFFGAKDANRKRTYASVPAVLKEQVKEILIDLELEDLITE